MLPSLNKVIIIIIIIIIIINIIINEAAISRNRMIDFTKTSRNRVVNALMAKLIGAQRRVGYELFVLVF